MRPIQLNEIPFEIREYLGTIHSIQFPIQGDTSDVGIMESSEGTYALKRTKEELFNSWLSKEVSVLNVLTAQTDLPVPKVNKFVEQTDKKENWALFDYIEGETIKSALETEENQEKRMEIIFNFGKILAEIHSTPPPKSLMHNQSWIDDMLQEAEYNLINYTVDGSRDLLHDIKINKPKAHKQTLIHGDYTIDNVLVHNGKISGVIDWGSGAFGDPRYDVSLAIRPKPGAFENEADTQTFFEGYGRKIISKKDYDYFVHGIYEFF
ncbi:phosphotransferase family protein [Virgibacillus flavescens]|uniref:phosphotransferase family protein n=1 Tax=Virgibacillus flavescens TaxID=1611422 RepID=UPI003D332123